jgi:hypothetical protein
MEAAAAARDPATRGAAGDDAPAAARRAIAGATRRDYTCLDTARAGAENPVVHRAGLVLVFAAAASLVAGCKRKADAPPCGAVGATFFALTMDGLTHATVDGDHDLRRAVEDQLPAMRDAIVHACTETQWSSAVRTCLVEAKDHVAFQTCEQQLTDAQRQALDHSGAAEAAH